MATREDVNIRIRAHDLYTQELNRAKKAFKVAGGHIGTAVKAGAIAAGAALAGLTVATYKAVTAANAQEDAEKKLAAALGFTSRGLLDQASALQKVSKYGDEAIIEAQALIAAYIKDEEQVKQATKATLDLAAAKGMNLNNAADLVAKTLGSSTNALSRYGVEVEGAVGSSERLESLTKNIAATFGGQAAAQAETFGGRITQLKNAYGDLWEELGFVITRNTFFLKALNVGKTLFENMSQRVKENREWLMELTKSGIIGLVKGLGGAVEVMRFFHNGWLGLKLVSGAVTSVMVTNLRLVLEALNLLLKPFNLIFDGLVKLGALDTNPLAAAFDAGREAVESLQEKSSNFLSETITQIEETNAKYDRTKASINGIVTELKNLKAAQADVGEGADKAPGALGLGNEPGKEDKGLAKARAAARASLGSLEDPTAFKPEDEFSKAWLGYQARLDAMEQYNTQKLNLMVQAGANQAAVELEYSRMVMDQEKKKRDFQIAAAGQVFGASANMLQNLTQVAGKEGGTMFEAMRAFSTAQALVDTYTAANKTWATLGYPWGIPAVAAVVAAGLANVAKIQNASPGSTAGTTVSAGGTATPSYSGGSTTAAPVPVRVEQDKKPTQNITLNVDTLDPSKVDWIRLAEREIIPALELLSGSLDYEMKIRVRQR